VENNIVCISYEGTGMLNLHKLQKYSIQSSETVEKIANAY